MVDVNIEVDFKKVERLARLYPRATQIAIDRYSEQAGRTIERHAKKRAPVVHGNLRRSIFFVPNSPLGGARVHAYANYAKNVHGAPYHQNARSRKETPFFTYALLDGQGQIRQYANAIIPTIFKNIGNN